MANPSDQEEWLRKMADKEDRCPSISVGGAHIGAIERYMYSFSVWPDETFGFGLEIFELFRRLNVAGRIEMTFITEIEFLSFRAGLQHDGITLREIERRPYQEPELIT